MAKAPKKEEKAKAAVAVKDETKVSKSIISAERRKAMKEREPDWVGRFLNKHGTTKDDKGVVSVDPQKIIELAKANNLNSDAVANLDGKNTGYIRMTVSNMMRAAARKRHGLFDPNGKFMKVDDEAFTLTETPTHDRTGKKIEAAKPAKEKAAA